MKTTNIYLELYPEINWIYGKCTSFSHAYKASFNNSIYQTQHLSIYFVAITLPENPSKLPLLVY